LKKKKNKPTNKFFQKKNILKLVFNTVTKITFKILSGNSSLELPLNILTGKKIYGVRVKDLDKKIK